MPLITEVPTTWSSGVTLSANELWQARAGTVYISTAASPGADDGLELSALRGLRLSSGLTVKYRRAPGGGTAVIAREQV
jgi:hypothetical protein